MKFNEHEILQRIGPILMSPRVIPSRAELARRAKLTDDMLLRFASGYSLDRGFELLTVENGKVKLTEKGRVAYELYSKLWALGDAEDCPKQTLRLQVESILGRFLALALTPVFDLWGSAIDRPSIWRLDCDVRRSLAEKKLDLALGFGELQESVSENEALGPPVQWCVLVPAGHRLGETQEPVSVDQIPKADWLLVPDLAFGTNGLAESFARAGHRQVMECDQPAEYVGTGLLAVVPDVFGSRCHQGAIKRRLDFPPLQVRLFLPRGGEAALHSASQCLVENLRRLARDGLSGIEKPETSQAQLEGVEEVFEAPVEETASPMEGVLS